MPHRTRALLAGTALSAGMFLLAARGGQVASRSTDCPLAESDLGSFVRVEGGGFVQGASALYAEEGPPRQVFVSSFLLQVHEVTNDDFAAFVAATGYVTAAERAEGSARFVTSATPGEPASWWRLDPGATWRSPEGEPSDLRGKGRHPVVHVTLEDARAYAAWAGARLPYEVEWEYAATRGLVEPTDPLSGARGPTGRARANVWTGPFPAFDTAEDGYAGTAPVGCFVPSRIGTYDLIGNVWEWTETRFGRAPDRYVIKGGSFLCSDHYCRRYRAAARQGVESGFRSAHTGFRIAKDL